MALCVATQGATWLRLIRTHYNKSFYESIIIYDDSQSCIDETKRSDFVQEIKLIYQRYQCKNDQALLQTIQAMKHQRKTQ